MSKDWYSFGLLIFGGLIIFGVIFTYYYMPLFKLQSHSWTYDEVKRLCLYEWGSSREANLSLIEEAAVYCSRMNLFETLILVGIGVGVIFLIVRLYLKKGKRKKHK